jgi:hypothetical protein
MAKIVQLAPDGSYLGLVDRDEYDEQAQALLVQAAERDAERAQSAAAAQPAEAEAAPPAAPAESETAAESVAVADLSYHELRAEAKLRGLVGYSHMKKDELRVLVEAARGE